MLGFFGVTDVRFVRAEGVAMGEAASQRPERSAAAHVAKPPTSRRAQQAA